MAISPIPIIAVILVVLLLIANGLGMTAASGQPKTGVSWIKLLLSAVNPKNLMMCAAAGIAISQGRLSTGGQIVAVAVFTVIAVSSVALPVIVYVADTARMRRPLDALKTWLERNNTTVMFVLLLVIGVVLIGKGIGGLID
ncbi:GAP family protein [Actinomadura sp. NPDC048394]|uniref:GAP family protein n=1 Tax=Actinomadura sp. NPDC048394 TaxID=3158223 RepID=UPI0033C3C87C